MVPSSSEDATRAMRGQPKRLSRNHLRRNGGKQFGKKSFSMFWFSKDSPLLASFLLSMDFVCFVLVLEFKISKPQRQRVQQLCTRLVIIRCSFVYRSVKQKREMTSVNEISKLNIKSFLVQSALLGWFCGLPAAKAQSRYGTKSLWH